MTFDVMKGIGILLVITDHFFNWNHPILGRVINSFHMPLFFIIAGYFSRPFTTIEDAKRCIRKYAKRLLPAFVLTQVFIILWDVLMAVSESKGWGPVIRESLTLFWADPHGPQTPWGQLSIGVVWFLLALFLAKCALLFISRLGGYAIPISILLALGAVMLYRVFPYSIWCISIGFTALPFVTLGWWFRTHIVPKWVIVSCIGCWIAALCFSHLVMYDFEWGCFPLDFLGACGGTFCVLLLSRLICSKTAPAARLFATLGIWSLAIMCFHDIETHCHIGNHVMALIPVSFPVWTKYLFRYVLTIAVAAIAVRLPLIKKVFA